MATKTYEKLQEELEKILQEMESKSLPIDKLVIKVKRAKEILEECKSRLRNVEKQLEL